MQLTVYGRWLRVVCFSNFGAKVLVSDFKKKSFSLFFRQPGFVLESLHRPHPFTILYLTALIIIKGKREREREREREKRRKGHVLRSGNARKDAQKNYFRNYFTLGLYAR